MPWVVLALALLLVASERALAIDVTSCGQFIPAGETGVLATDLQCTRAPTWPFSARGVIVDGGATVQLNGHSITGDGTGVGIDCEPQGRRSFKQACRIVGTGEVSGFELGIGVVGVIEVTGVTARRNRVGMSAPKCCHLFVNDVVASDNEISGVSAYRLSGDGLHAERNGMVGVQSFRMRLSNVTATGNGAMGGVHGRGVLRDSVVTGNAGFDGTYDILAWPRVRTRNTTCGRGIRLRTIFKPGGVERTDVLGEFACR
jgi:hypothetical protein